MPVELHSEPGGHVVVTSTIEVPRPHDETFAFFADARNLERITPPLLRFRITGGVDEHGTTFAGQLIDYRLRLRGVPVRWRTRISRFDAPHAFVDEQLRGPYRSWVHEHTFEPKPGEPGVTLVRDRITYRAPGGPLIERMFVRRDVRAIFDFREQRVLELLG